MGQGLRHFLPARRYHLKRKEEMYITHKSRQEKPNTFIEKGNTQINLRDPKRRSLNLRGRREKKTWNLLKSNIFPYVYTL